MKKVVEENKHLRKDIKKDMNIYEHLNTKSLRADVLRSVLINNLSAEEIK